MGSALLRMGRAEQAAHVAIKMVNGFPRELGIVAGLGDGEATLQGGLEITG